MHCRKLNRSSRALLQYEDEEEHKVSRIVIIGGVAGGASAAARIRRLDEEAQILILERGPHISYSNCSLPFYLSRVVSNSKALLVMTPERFKKQYNIDVCNLREAISIDRGKKQVKVKNVETGETYSESYDKLVLAPGAAPVMPQSIPGINSSHVFGIRNVADIQKLDACILKNKDEDIAVIGGGFVGIEVAENLAKAGRKVHLIEGQDQILLPFDEDMIQILHKELLDNGVDLILGDSAAEIREKEILLSSGGKVAAGVVVMAIGVRPETSLAEEAGLKIGETGGIAVNTNGQTSDPDIYAVGDAVEVYSELMHRKTRLAMAGVAQWQARTAADHIAGIPGKVKGVLGSSVIKVFSMNAACTGLNERTCAQLKIPCQFAFVLPNDKVGIMPDCHTMFFKLIFEVPTGRILGAQAIGRGETDKRINVIAAMIRMKGTLQDLKDLELCYSPMFSTAKDVVNYAALVGLNLLEDRIRQVPVSKVRELVEQDAYIVDVREKTEYDAGHLRNAKNIPLSEFRERIQEIPRDRDVYLHCRSSQRSYNAALILLNRGYSKEHIFNISGSYLGICLYEYYRDQALERDPILTAYNFR